MTNEVPDIVVDLPTYEQVESVKQTIDETSGKVLDNKGIKYLPIMREEMVSDLQISSVNLPGTSSHFAVLDDWLFIKQVSSPLHIFYNKKNKVALRVEFQDATYYSSVLGFTSPSSSGYVNSGRKIVQDGNNIMFLATISGGATRFYNIDTSKFNTGNGTLSVSGNAALSYTNYSMSSTNGGISKTRKYIFVYQSGSFWRMNAGQQHGTSNPLMSYTFSGETVGGVGIKSVFGIIDAMDENQDIVILFGEDYQNNGFICKYDMKSRTVQSYVRQSVTYVKALGELPIYENDIIQISSNNDRVIVFNKKTLAVQLLWSKITLFEKFIHDITDEYFTLKIYISKPSIQSSPSVRGNFIRCSLEKFYFSGRDSELLAPLLIKIDDMYSQTAQGAILPIYGRDKNESYILCADMINDGSNGLFLSKYCNQIKGYEELL